MFLWWHKYHAKFAVIIFFLIDWLGFISLQLLDISYKSVFLICCDLSANIVSSRSTTDITILAHIFTKSGTICHKINKFIWKLSIIVKNITLSLMILYMYYLMRSEQCLGFLTHGDWNQIGPDPTVAKCCDNAMFIIFNSSYLLFLWLNRFCVTFAVKINTCSNWLTRNHRFPKYIYQCRFSISCNQCWKKEYHHDG